MPFCQTRYIRSDPSYIREIPQLFRSAKLRLELPGETGLRATTGLSLSCLTVNLYAQAGTADWAHRLPPSDPQS